MGYGVAWGDQPLEFPQILADTEIDRRFSGLPPEGAALRARRYQPIEVVDKHYPHVADRLKLLWGGNLFDRYVEMLAEDARRPGCGFPREVAGAFSDLLTLHRSPDGLREGIASWVDSTIDA